MQNVRRAVCCCPVSTGARTPGRSDELQQRRSRPGATRWLLLVPYLALLFPALYARNTPMLWGFPFFYWYQLLWVLLTSVVLGVVYYAARD